MNEPKFTGPPWTVYLRDFREGECGPGMWIMGGRRSVVDTGAIDVFPLSPADKALIEAAPEMYTELAHLLRVLEAQPVPTLGQWNWPYIAGRVRALLAFARGAGPAPNPFPPLSEDGPCQISAKSASDGCGTGTSTTA